MMRTNINYYALLGVSSTATQEEITRAFRKRILEVHLDKRPGEDTDLCYKTIEAHRVLSDRNLRIKYDIEFGSTNKVGETFIPAGYICYDVGQDQMSKRVMEYIFNWRNEYDRIKSTSGGFSDNYFACMSNLMGQGVDSEMSTEKTPHYSCSICDKQFSTQQHHWEQVLCPYIAMFSCDKSGVHSLLMYFKSILGQEFFNWEPRYLPLRLLGIWGSPEWNSLSECDQAILRILAAIPPSEYFKDTEEHISYIEETFLSDSETNEERFPKVACEILCWVLEYQDFQDMVIERVNDLLRGDEVMEIMYLVSVMKNVLNCSQEEWTDLVSDALNSEQFELAMLWTKIAIGFDELPGSEWFELGMKVYKADPIVAHFCFLSGGYESEDDWEFLANEFTRRKNHFASIEYHLNFNTGNLERLLKKSKTLAKTDPNGAKFYWCVYYTNRAKSILVNLPNGESMSGYGKELQELVELIDEFAPDSSTCLEGFKIIVNTWPMAFDELPCYGVHRSTMDILGQPGYNNSEVKSLNLMLAAMHYLPDEEVDEEFMSSECILVTTRGINRSLRSSDFSSLADVLLNLTERSLPGAAQILEQLDPTETLTHLKSMKLLISGTVNKTQKNWDGAMRDYQNALLCAPECSHRIIPCIIKLTQDTEFHSSVVDKVQSEVKVLKDLVDRQEYLQVDTYGSSIVITDVAPKTVSLYKNAISKIQADPDKKVDPSVELPEQEPPPVETNTPLVTLDKNEEAIESSQGMGGLNSALAYIDLLKALPLPFQPGPIVMAASHFLQAMDESDDLGSIFAYRNAIILMAENLIEIDQKSQAAIQHCLTHRQMLSILLSAHEKLSKAVGADKSEIEETKSESRVELITNSEANLLSKFFKNVVNFPKLEPLANIPTLSCSDLIYVETLGNSFLNQFIFEKVNQDKDGFSKIPKYLQAYTHFIEVWKGRSLLTDYATARVKAMEELLALKKLTLKDVESFMNFPMLNLTNKGWSPEFVTELRFANGIKAFQSIHGFKIESGQISFLCSTATKSSGNLFEIKDILEIFFNGIEKSSLRLISPDDALRSHPFNELQFEPKHLHKSNICNYLQTLSRVAMLLCFFSSGLEICARSPFMMRSTEEGLLLRLSEHLQHFLRPVSARKKEKSDKSNEFSNLNIPTQFQLDMTEVFAEDEDGESGCFTYKVGDVISEVKVANSAQHPAPDVEFSQDFTRHYNETGKHFPELLRLKELVKISVIRTKLKKIWEENLTLLKQNGRTKEEICRIANVCKVIEQLGILNDTPAKVNDIGRTGIGNILECPWLPSTSCNNVATEVYEVSAGINMNPNVIYGPVSIPKGSVFISAKEFIKAADNYGRKLAK